MANQKIGREPAPEVKPLRMATESGGAAAVRRLDKTTLLPVDLSRAFGSFEAASRATLAYLHRQLGFRLWMMTQTVGEDWVVLHAEDHGYGVKDGDIFRWTDSFCSRMVKGLGPRIAPKVDEVPIYLKAPIGQLVPIGAYVGVPIVHEGTLFGTLCAIDPDPQPEAIADQLGLVELLAGLLATSLNADRKTEQMRCAGQELVAERRRLDFILRGTNVGTWEWNVQTGETVFNERWAEIIGYTLDELSPVSIETWMQFAHPDDLQESGELLQRHFNGELEFYEYESRMRHKDGHWIWVLDRGKVFSWTEKGEPLAMFGSHQEITKQKNAEQALRQSEERYQALAKSDGLTGLLNRRGWEECLQIQESMARRYDHCACVAMVDLDGLKVVNDEQGHEAGDQLIVRAAACLQQAVREVDKVARLGGDEFAILGVQCDQNGADALEQRIAQALGAAGIAASWGVAMRDPEQGLQAAVIQADRGMYRMKTLRRASSSAAEIA